MSMFLVTIKNNSEERREVVKTSKKAICKSTLERRLLRDGEKISKIEFINATDDIDIILGNKHMITFVGSIIFATESIVRAFDAEVGQITCVNTKDLLKETENRYWDRRNRITIEVIGA